MNQDPATPPEAGAPSHKPVKALRFVVLLVLAAVLVAAVGVNNRSKDESKLATWTNEQAIINVAVDHPELDKAIRKVTLPGNVDAFYAAEIHGQVSGYVQNWKYDIGAQVKAGQVLATIDTPEVDQRVTAAQGELAKAKANQALAHVTADRWRTLSGSSAVSQQAIDEKEAGAKAADAEVDAAKANLQKLQALKGFAKITAPFDGVITARNIDIGSLVSADGTNNKPLFVVSDVHEMRIYVRAPQVYAAVLKIGMKATLLLPDYPDRTFEAHIATTSSSIDSESRALLVELHADNKDGLLKPGAFAQVAFELPPEPNAMTVFSSTLLFRGVNTFVAAVDNQSRIRLKNVRIARDYGARVQVVGGLSLDDRIVRNPPESLGEGDLVRVAGEDSGKTANAGVTESKLAEDARK
jgi:RND family efflux transporter MFP subunit